MSFPIDLLTRVDTLSRRASEELIAMSDRGVTPETKSLLIAINKLKRNVRDIDFDRANSVTSYKFLQDLIKYFEVFFRDFTVQRSCSYTQWKKECAVIFQGKLEHFLDSFDTVIYFDKNHLFSLPPEHERWERLRRFVKIHKYENQRKITGEVNYILNRLALGQASLIDAYSTSGTISKTTFAASLLYYSIFRSSVVRTIELFHTRPKLEFLKILYNIPETNMVRVLLNFVMPFISVNDKFFIPRTVSHIFQPLQYKNNDPSLQYTLGDNVSVRFLSNARRFYNALIIHIHGGGFIAMSSRSHQCYTRKWVRSLDIPCISIDYRLSPENRFPAALDDVWQVYNWVLRFGESKLNIRPDKVFLIGDSAGGNFALSLTYRILEENLKAPNGLLLGYPALNCFESQFSPSLLNSLEDKLVPLSYLMICIRSYLPSQYSNDDYYISPSIAPVSILSRMPPIRIAAGDKDFLVDESWQFTERLLDAGVDVEFSVFEGMIHGALSFCFKGGMTGSQAMVDKFEQWIRDLLNCKK